MRQYRVSVKLPYDSVELIYVFVASGMVDLFEQVDNLMSATCDEYDIVSVRRCSEKVGIYVDYLYLN